MLEYRDHPDTSNEVHRKFDLIGAGGDYYFVIHDVNRGVELLFRYCISTRR